MSEHSLNPPPSNRSPSGTGATEPEIFLSYNREDQAVARRFVDAFDHEGFKDFWDAALRRTWVKAERAA